MTSLDHWDASLSKHVYSSILYIRSICIGLVARMVYHIPELLTIIKIVDNADINRIIIKIKKNKKKTNKQKTTE